MSSNEANLIRLEDAISARVDSAPVRRAFARMRTGTADADPPIAITDRPTVRFVTKPSGGDR
jgi:hypothetical protein